MKIVLALALSLAMAGTAFGHMDFWDMGGKSGEESGESSHESGSREQADHHKDFLNKMWDDFQGWKEHVYEKKMEMKEEMMEQFRAWREWKMKKMAEEHEREERERRAMETLRKKQMMIQKMANLSEEYREMKLKLVHGVVSQFLEFCSCAETSGTIKKFFTHNFGDLYSMDWNNMEDHEEKEEMFEIDWEMFSRRNMSTNCTTSMANSTRMFGNDTGANVTVTVDTNCTTTTTGEQAYWNHQIMKFSMLSHKERTKVLFGGLVKSLCKRAKEYVGFLKQLERMYVMWEAYHRD